VAFLRHRDHQRGRAARRHRLQEKSKPVILSVQDTGDFTVYQGLSVQNPHIVGDTPAVPFLPWLVPFHGIAITGAATF